MKLKTLQKIIKEYELIDGQIITGGLLKQIAEEQKMLVNEVITLLGIAERNKYKIINQETITMRINIKDNLEREKIKNKVQELFLNRDKITRQEMEKLEKQIKMSGKLIGDYLGIDSKKYYALKHNHKYVHLKLFYYNKKEFDDEIIKALKTKDKITKQEVESIKKAYNKTDSEMIQILRTRAENYKNLMSGKTTYLKIDLFTKEEEDIIIQKIKNYKNDGNITIEDVKHIKETINATDRIIKKAYGIKSSVYKNLLEYKIKSSRIIDAKEKKKVQLLKIEMKYNPKYGERYYTKRELRQIAKKQEVKFEAMLFYLNNPNYYCFNCLALEKNPLGIWIGDNKEISNEFWSNNINLLEKLSYQAASSVSFIYGAKHDKNELQQIAYQNITNSGFLIEKNFRFDKRLQNNLFRKKGKYGILKFLREQNKLYSYQQYEAVCGITEERYKFFIDNRYNPDNLFEYQTELNLSKIPIRKHHKQIVALIDKFKDIIFTNRKHGLKIIARKINISLMELEKYIKEIQKILIDNKIVRKVGNGGIIQMNEE